MNTLAYTCLSLGAVLLVGLNVLIWGWFIAAFHDWWLERRDAGLLQENIRLHAQIRNHKDTIATQHAELMILHEQAGAIQAAMQGGQPIR